MGQKLLEKEARRFKLSLKSYRSRLVDLVPEFKVSDFEDLLAGVGFGKVSARQVINQLVPEKNPQEETRKELSYPDSLESQVSNDSDLTIQVKGHDDLLVFRARCCNPIQGEEIIGYITPGRGISVHARRCPNVENLLLNPERKIEVQWSNRVRSERYPVCLSISTENRPGVLADITAAVSELKTNIANVQARTVESYYGDIDITVEVRDVVHLDKIIQFLKSISGVQAVNRTKGRSRR